MGNCYSTDHIANDHIHVDIKEGGAGGGLKKTYLKQLCSSAHDILTIKHLIIPYIVQMMFSYDYCFQNMAVR